MTTERSPAMREKIAWVVVCLSVGWVCEFAGAATLWVPGGYGTIQAAIQDANDGDVVIVAAGTYQENIDFLGLAITVRSSDPNDPCVVAATIIDGSDPCDDTYGSVVTFRSGEESDSVLDGFTLTGGVGKGPGPWRLGGGIFCEGAGPTVRNCVITANDASTLMYGAGVFCRDANDVLFSNCAFSDNVAGWWGGGMLCDNAEVTLLNCNFSNNAANAGGGMYVVGEKTITMRGPQSRFEGNQAQRGGAIWAQFCELSLRRVSFVGNVADFDGGAMFLAAPVTGEVENCTVAGNKSRRGAGMFCEAGSVPTLTNCVFVDNQATLAGAGGAMQWYGGNGPEASSSIIRDNGDVEIWADGGIGNVAFCNLAGSDGSNHNIDVDPCFVARGYWNDPNVFDSWTDGDYHLRNESRCIDVGDPNFVGRLEQKDCDDEPRFSGFFVDMGVDETYPQRRVYNSNKDTWSEFIDAALLAASDGDELIVRPERYVENISFYHDARLSSVYAERSEAVAVTVIDGSGFNHGPRNRAAVQMVSSDSLGGEIDGFTIVGGIGRFEVGGGPRMGGGVYCEGGTRRIRRCVIENNSAAEGGGVACSGAVVSVEQCIIKNNAATDFGGGIANLAGSVIAVSNSAIVLNKAEGGTGGGVHSEGDSIAYIDFCTIKQNDDYGLYADPNAEVYISNSILWDNDPNDPNDPNNLIVAAGAVVTIDYSVVAGGWSGIGANNTDEDPKFEGELVDAGDDPNDPNDDVWSWHDYRLMDSSPCINAGDPDYQSDSNDVDVEGQARVSYCRVDIGADEADDLFMLGLAGLVYNVNQSTWYCSINEAVDEVRQKQMLIVGKGRYYENVIVDCCDVFIRGTQPSDPNTVAETIIDGSDQSDPCDVRDPNYGAAITLVPGLADRVTIKGLSFAWGTGNWFDPNNQAGGGIHCIGNDDVTVEQCYFKGNSADYGGGAYFRDSDDLNLKLCYFVENEAFEGGAGLYLKGLLNPYVGYNVINGNQSVGLGNNGAGVYLRDCNDVVLDHNLITDNSGALYGGGIYAYSVDGLSVEFSTVFGNDASAFGGGLSAGSGNKNVSVSNSILWNNGGDEIFANDPNVVDIRYCDVEGGYAGEGNIDIDPCFVDPRLVATGYDFTLWPSSPCINRGDPCYVPIGEVLDLAGNDRVAWAWVDMGAYESHDADANYLADVIYNESSGEWYRTLVAALGDVEAGERIVLAAGTYAGNFVVEPNDVLIVSMAPWDPETVAATILDGNDPCGLDLAPVITLTAGTADGFTVDGVTIRGGMGWLDVGPLGDPCDDVRYGGGIYSPGVDRVTIRRSVIEGNSADVGAGVYLADGQGASITNTIIAGNSADTAGGGVGIARSSGVEIAFSTIADNSAGVTGGGLSLDPCAYVTLTNSIVWGNSPNQVEVSVDSYLTVSFSDVEGGYWGMGNMDVDPCFVDAAAGDYHLATQGEWYDGLAWVMLDDYTSRAIDAGNPGIDPAAEEQDPNEFRGDNVRVNMGAYGNTSEAAIAPSGWAYLTDLSNDGSVGVDDLGYMTEVWLSGEVDSPGDVNRDGRTDLDDFALLAEESW